MHHHNDAETLLTLWEHAHGHTAAARADALLRAAADAEPAHTLGERNARLMELHARLFGREIDLVSHCPGCRTAAQFAGDCDALVAQMRPSAAAAQPQRLEMQGHVIDFRLPDSADIAIAAHGEPSVERFERALLERCVLGCVQDGAEVPARELPQAVLDALSKQMETLDPGASVSFALECPQCATHWDAALDVGELLWQKVRAAAERVLLDIDVLAHAYGWTEREVLRLRPLRRAAYLQMATA